MDWFAHCNQHYQWYFHGLTSQFVLSLSTSAPLLIPLLFSRRYACLLALDLPLGVFRPQDWRYRPLKALPLLGLDHDLD